MQRTGPEFRGIHAFYEDQSMKDLTIYIGPERHVVKAHKALLCAQSPFFKGVCTAGFRESESNEVSFPEFTNIAVFERVIKYFYLGHMQDDYTSKLLMLSLAQWIDVLILADMLLVDHLIESSFHRLIDAFNGRRFNYEAGYYLEMLNKMYQNLPERHNTNMKQVVHAFVGLQSSGMYLWRDVCAKVRAGTQAGDVLDQSLVADLMETHGLVLGNYPSPVRKRFPVLTSFNASAER